MFDGPIFSNPIYSFGLPNNGSTFSADGLSSTDFATLTIKQSTFTVTGVVDANFANYTPDINLTVNITNTITANLTLACKGIKCVGYNPGCVTWRYKKAKNSSDGAWVPAITVCDLRIYN